MDLQYLSEDQNVSFDEEYHSPKELAQKVLLLRAHFGPDGPATILDAGGGNGTFLDAMLDAFPKANGTVLDVSRLLLARNKSHPRKAVVEASLEQAPALFAGRRFDLITTNWLPASSGSATAMTSPAPMRSARCRC